MKEFIINKIPNNPYRLGFQVIILFRIINY